MTTKRKGALHEEVRVREFEIRNRFGIHARPAALFVKTAAKYLSEITVKRTA